MSAVQILGVLLQYDDKLRNTQHKYDSIFTLLQLLYKHFRLCELFRELCSIFTQMDILKLSDLIKTEIVQQLLLILFDLNSKLNGLMICNSSV